jgi:hypothetical protein
MQDERSEVPVRSMRSIVVPKMHKLARYILAFSTMIPL